MRGKVQQQVSMLFAFNAAKAIPSTHPIRRIKTLADEALAKMSPLFDEMYGDTGRPSIPPERLLKSSILMALYSIRSERRFCEDLSFNFLYRWFLDLDVSEEAFDHSVFSINRQRLLEHDVAHQFFLEVATLARAQRLLSADHFSVDGTLIEAWASMKSFRPKGEKPQAPPSGGSNPWKDFKGQTRKNDTHESTTDPEAKLVRKADGQEARLSFAMHAMMENRNGLLTDVLVAPAVGMPESRAALALLDRLPRRRGITVGGDKGYDTKEFTGGCRERGATPHVTQNHGLKGGSRIDGRTTRHPGYRVSQVIRRRIEEIFGWIKTTGGFARTRVKGVMKTQLAAYLVGAAYNLMRMARLLDAPA